MTNFVTTKRALLTSVLSLTLCFAMLLGTTFAWFTDTVTSSGNVIQTGDLDVEMYYADGTKDPADVAWENADGAAIFNYDNWEPGYADAKHIKIVNNGTLSFDWMLRITSSNVVGKLAEVIDVYYFKTATEHASRADLSNATLLGTLEDVMNTTHNISDDVNGTLYPVDAENVPADAVVGQTAFTLVLVMQEDAGNEYQGLSVGSDLSIQVFATQRSFEEDSFGADYDGEGKVPSLELPAAYVREIGKDEIVTLPDNDNDPDNDVVLVGKNNEVSYTLGIGGAVETGELDTAFQFLPTETLDAAEVSEYRYWHADFVVTMDGDVKAESIALAGYYDAWCSSLNNNNWVALVAGEDIAAGTEIRLVELLGATVNYEELCKWGNDTLGFMCGALDLDGSNTGKTLTVELRVYETTKDWDASSGTANEETGRYVTIGEYSYKFTSPLPTAEVTRQTQYEDVSIEWENFGEFTPNYTIDADPKLEAAFTFQTKDTTETVANSAYKDWICDYYVSLDRDLGENQILLGGNYGGFGWVGFHNGDVTLAAGEEIPLLGSVTQDMTYWTYQRIVESVNTFICGVGDVNDALNGATFTVHLRVTNPNDSTESYNVNTVTYKFGTGEVVITDINDIVTQN